MNLCSNLVPRFRWLTLSMVAIIGTPLAAQQRPEQRGKVLFEREWKFEAPPKMEQGVLNRHVFEQQLRDLPGDGLGPMFNANSCEACHAAGGASGVNHNVTLITLDPRSPFIKSNRPKEQKQKDKESLLDLYPGLISPRGQVSMDVVVHEYSTTRLFEMVRNKIGTFIPGGIPDHWYKSETRTSEAIANNPVLAGRKGDIDFYLSQRNSPPLFGLGLIDRIERSKLMQIARLQERRTHGKVTGRLGLGKFGWRAQTATLDQFVRGACAGEVGLQLQNTPQPNDVADETYVSLGIDLAETQVHHLVSYIRALPHPMQETKLAEEATDIREGKRLFVKIGCSMCHVENVYPAKGIYSDLLLHDMGSLLQAPSPAPPASTKASIQLVRIPTYRPESPPLGSGASIGGYYGIQSASAPIPFAFARPNEPKFPYGKLPAELTNPKDTSKITWDAMQREWRTPPLWGVADSGPYLHDGRAETLDAAIRWHDGEGADPTRHYRSLPSAERKKIISFLKSLRSPPAAERIFNQQFAPNRPVGAPSVVAKTKTTTPNEIEPGSLEETIKVFQVGL